MFRRESTALIVLSGMIGCSLMIWIGGKALGALGDYTGHIITAVAVVIGIGIIGGLIAFVITALGPAVLEYLENREIIRREKEITLAEQKIGGGFLTSPTRGQEFDYDVALSFAGEDRAYAEELANYLTEREISVFYDAYEQDHLWGKNLYDHLHKLYSEDARFCVMFVSDYYAKKIWTNHERKAAQQRALKEHGEYILPIRVDDTKLPGLTDTTGFMDVRTRKLESIADLLARKVRNERQQRPNKTVDRNRPPAQSRS